MGLLYLIKTRNGEYIGTGKDEHDAKIQFTINYPSEKIRSIRNLEVTAIEITGIAESEMIDDGEE